MGVYLNFPGATKEEWLDRNAELVSRSVAGSHDDYTNKFLVVWVHNGAFTAAAVVFKPEEKTEFLDPYDARPKRFFIVDKEKLPEYVITDLKHRGVLP